MKEGKYEILKWKSMKRNQKKIDKKNESKGGSL